MIKHIFLIILSILFYFLITRITNTLNIFLNGTNIILTILFLFTIYSYSYKKSELAFIFYMIFVFVFLLSRQRTNVNVSFDFYLIKWLKFINKNQIVFINIMGNIVLFIPLVFFLKTKFYFFDAILIVIALELLQLLTKRGVFDIVDIVLNVFGIFVATIFKWRITNGRK